MRSVHDFDGIFLFRDPVDMRMWIDGLAALVEREMELDAFGRLLFVFTNRVRDKVKILYWDRTGFAVWYKRLEREAFIWPLAETVSVSVTTQQLTWLLDGYDLRKMKPHETLKFAAVS